MLFLLIGCLIEVYIKVKIGDVVSKLGSFWFKEVILFMKDFNEEVMKF